MIDCPVMVITGVRKGIGRYLTEYYVHNGFCVVGCSRKEVDYQLPNFEHFCLDIADEVKVRELFSHVRKAYGFLDVLINNAGIALMNHAILTPAASVQKIFNTNFLGTFLFCREAAKLMQRKGYGRIVNFTSVATPLKIEGEAVYAASKAAVTSLTQVLAREFASFGITVNAVGPTPIKTDLIRSVPFEKLDQIIKLQAIPRFGEFRDVSNVIDFFIKPESNFITGQVIFLGGI
jgi:3-oxoacyl-[acyl-carrier protein] reductase